MMIVMVLFWALVIVGIAWLLRTQPWTPPRSEHDALNILGRRFAAGKIFADEYRQRRAVLRDEDPSGTSP